jgi:hypothetical protein
LNPLPLKPVPWANAKFALTVAKADKMSNVAIFFGIISKSSEKRLHRWRERGGGPLCGI